MHGAEKILIVDDNPGIREAVQVTLALDGYHFTVAENGRQALALAFSERPDLVVLDLMMPEMDGLECCRTLKSSLATRSIPIILLTAEDDPDDVVRGLEAGADDYVTKPFNPKELRARVASALRRTRSYVDTDPLTHLPGNRVLREELNRRVAAGGPTAVCYIDLDYFKAFVDAYGFERASQVIVAVARLCSEAVVGHGGEHSFVGHIGGDDFVALCAPERAPAVCRALIAAFEAQREAFYDEADRIRGCLHGHDRDGRERDFPLMSITIAVLIVGPGGITDLETLAYQAAVHKQQLKLLPNSNWRVFE